MTTFDVVRFACRQGDEPKVFLLTEAAYDRWVVGEPPEGYAKFELVGSVTLDEVTPETLADLRELMPDGAADELARWRALGRQVLEQKFDDLCWMDLYRAAAQMLGVEWKPELLPKPLMMRNCEKYVDALAAGCGYKTPAALPAVARVLEDYERALSHKDIPNPEEGRGWLGAARAELKTLLGDS